MDNNPRWLIGLVGAVVTLGIFVISVTFKMGHHSARIEALEEWRGNVRLDMHEISELIQALGTQMAEIKTLIEERTERRSHDREH